MNHIHHIKEREHYCHDNDSDNPPDSDDDDGFYHTGKPLDYDIYFLIVANRHFLQHTGKRSGLFSDLDGHGQVNRETIHPSFESGFVFSDGFPSNLSLDVFSSERRREGFPHFYIGEYRVDFRLVVSIGHTSPDDRERSVHENSSTQKSGEKFGKYDEYLFTKNRTEDRKRKYSPVKFVPKTRIFQGKKKSCDTEYDT